MLTGASERFVPIPEGNAGALVTLQHMRGLILASDPLVTDFTDKMSEAAALECYQPVELAEIIFNWVRSRMTYTVDYNDGTVIEEIRTPGYLLYEITQLGTALGDCDDYVVLLGAIYSRLGFPVTLVAISRHVDQQLDHVYLAIDTDEGRVVADGIVPDPFGWEVPESEITHRVEVSV